ncbi:MAG: Uma2 family endonuclease [Isosphaeraceae bacterium]
MSTRLETTDLGRLRYHLTALQLEAMIEAGIFPAGDDLELLGGVLYKVVKKEPHNFAVAQAADALRRLLPEGYHVREEKSLRLSKRSLPEPDVVVAVGRAGSYRPRPPDARDVALLVEVCHHSQKADYQDKYRRYAAAGVPAYWIVDLHRRCVQVFTGAVGRGTTARYSESDCYGEDLAVPVMLLGQTAGAIAVKDLLPPAEAAS